MTFRKLWLLSAFFVAPVFPVIAQEGHEGHAHGDHDGHAHEGEEGGDEQAQMMELYMKLATPGEHHKHLNAWAGKWSVTNKYRMTPEMPWTESTGVSESKWILGGRFLVTEYTGDPMMGMPGSFEGFGIMGYDNGGKRYQSIWMDNMGTLIAVGEGSCDQSGKVITIHMSYEDPMSGQTQKMRNVYKTINDDKLVFEMHMTAPDGSEFLGMEITYTRVAG